MKEGNCRDYYGGYCYFHPKEDVIGVCHLCLNERLLILAAKHGVIKSNSSKYDYYTSKKSYTSSFYENNNNNNSTTYYHNQKAKLIPKLFTISSFFNTKDNSIRHRNRRRYNHRDDFDNDFIDDADATSTSIEDESFISIKFGDNGVASWDKTSSTKSNKVSLKHCKLSWGGQTSVKDALSKGCGSQTVVEHVKPRPFSMRWQKRIGQLLQIIKWKKNNKSNGGGGNNSKVKVMGGVKVG